MEQIDPIVINQSRYLGRKVTEPGDRDDHRRRQKDEIQAIVIGGSKTAQAHGHLRDAEIADQHP